MGRGKHHKQISLAFVVSDRSVWATLALPPLMVCVLSWSKVGPGLRALPRSKLLRFRFSGTPQRHRIGWACVLCPTQVQAAQVTRYLVSTLSQLDGASYHLPGPSHSVSWMCSKRAVSGVPCISSGWLISDCNPPGRYQLSRIPGRLG